MVLPLGARLVHDFSKIFSPRTWADEREQQNSDSPLNLFSVDGLVYSDIENENGFRLSGARTGRFSQKLVQWICQVCCRSLVTNFWVRFHRCVSERDQDFQAWYVRKSQMNVFLVLRDRMTRPPSYSTCWRMGILFVQRLRYRMACVCLCLATDTEDVTRKATTKNPERKKQKKGTHKDIFR